MFKHLKMALALRRAHGARRDTDADWQKIGSDEPFFGVITDPRFLRNNIDSAARAAFFQSGEEEVQYHLARQNKYFGEFQPKNALDFGCGVGRLTRALARQTGDATGVDVSDGMIREARQLDELGMQFRKDLPDRLFDWVVSIIVFQHIPPEKGYVLLRDLLTRLAPGGGVTLQFSIYRDVEHRISPGTRIDLNMYQYMRSSKALVALPVGEIVMFDYDLSSIVAILFEFGVDDLNILHSNHGGFHGVYINGRKAP